MTLSWSLRSRPRTGEPARLEQDLRRIVAVFLCLVACVLATNVVGMTWFLQLRDTNTRVLRPAEAANDLVARDLLAAQSALRGYSATGAKSVLDVDGTSDAQLRHSVAALRDWDTKIPRELLTAQEQELESWLHFRTTTEAAVASGRTVDRTLLQTPFPRLVAANSAVGRWLSDTVQRTSTTVTWISIGTAIVLVAELAGMVVVMAVMRRHVVKSIVGPLEQLRDVVSLSGRGRRAPTDIGPTEIRELSVVVNAHVDALERSEETRELVLRQARAQDDVTRAVRQATHEQDILDGVRAGLSTGLDGERLPVTVRFVMPDDHGWPASGELRRRVIDAMGEGAGSARGFAVAADPVHDLPEAFRDVDLGAGVTSWVAVAAGAMADESSGRSVPMILVTGEKGREWHPREIGFVTRIGEIGLLALEQVRLDADRRETIARLEALDRQKTDFMSTVSHELRTPLTSIAGYLELLDDGDYGEVTATQRGILGIIERNASRLRDLIEDLLVLGRIESHGIDLAVDRVDLQQVVDDVAENLRPQALAGSVALVVRHRCTDAVVDGDSGHLCRAVTNIVGNAVKFTPAGGVVTVDVRDLPGGFEVAVTDSGIGIPEADLADIGQRFFRASNATEQAVPGTGLGLSIVRAIADAHGGGVSIDSTVGVGTRVCLRVAREVPAPLPA